MPPTLPPACQAFRPATIRPADRDRVEHDRRDDLTDAAGDLEHAGDPRVPAPTDIATRRITVTWMRRRQVDHTTDLGGDERGQQVLALDADVEQVHAEPDRCGDAGEEQWRRPVEDVDLKVSSLLALLDHVAVRIQRVAAGERAARSMKRRSRTRAPSSARATSEPFEGTLRFSITPPLRGGTGHVRAEVARRDGRPGRAWRRSARGTSRRWCRTDRSARRGRR